MRGLFIFLLCISNWCFSQSEDFQFRHLTTTEGLSQSSAIAIHQDKLGQIWIGTRDGLNKYDGHKFTVYRNDPENKNSLSNNDILSLEEDQDGFIWVGTYNGLNKYNPKTDQFTQYFHNQDSTSLSNNTISCIKAINDGTIWIGTLNGLSVYNKTNDSFKTYFKDDAVINTLSSNHILSILQTKTNKIWVGTTKGLSKYSFEEATFENFFSSENSSDAPNIYIQDIIEGRRNNLVLATRNNGVLEFRNENKTIQPYFENTIDQTINPNVRKLLFDENNSLWIGSYNGLYVSKSKNEVQSVFSDNSNNKSISKNSIKSLYKDKKGSIWIGTYYGGVNIWDISNSNFTNISQTASSIGLSYNVVSSIVEKDNLLFIGTEGEGISILDTKNNSFSYLNKRDNVALTNNNIKSLLIDENILWIGTFNTGIVAYNITNKKFISNIISNELSDYLKNTGVYDIAKDKNNNLWIASFGKGLIKYNLITNKFKIYSTHSNNKLSNDLVRVITIDSENSIWVGTERGLNKVASNGEIDYYFFDANVESGDDIATIFEDSNRVLWVGTKAKGLFKLDNNTFNNIELSNIKNTSAIHSILEDDNKNLWISTNQGVIKYGNGKSLAAYNLTNGLVNNEFNDNASFKSNDKFYFGGPTGITVFNPKKITSNNYAPQVLITGFKIKNKSIAVNDDTKLLKQTILFTKKIELSHEQGNFTIEFSIPNFINASNNSYKYRLKGLEEDWITTNQNIASYTIQNPGDYIFEVKGGNSDGFFNEQATQLAIEVVPAPWRSWWAFMLYALAILTALYFLTTILKSKEKLKTQLNLEHLETERTKEINKSKLEFFTNISHEFRTPLTLILGPLQQILQDYKGSSKMYKKLLVIESSGNHLLQLINRLMDFRKLENNLFKLETAEGNIVKFIKEIYLSFSEYAKDGGYTYDFETTDEEILVYYDRYKLERVFYNLISNAFRYTPRNGKILIKIEKTDNAILVKVEDSGVGISEEFKDKIFERFFEVAINNKPDNTYNKGTGIGLSIAKNIVDLHKGQITVDNNTPKGSIFEVTLLLGNTHLAEDEIIKDFKFSDDLSQYLTQLENPNVFLEEEVVDQLISKKQATILLVEDNAPLRKFMCNLLKADYNIIEAENGNIAYKKAVKHSPDIIVSDVIMPKMTGTELCSVIKENLKTSHIPIILLTSRTSLIYRIEGLESGADDYISKPFNVDEFKIRIKNLLKSTSRLKEKFTSEDILLPNEVAISSIDEKLLKKALVIVEENIGNEQFDIPTFCSELGVSRTMLFVKIKAWTNFTPNEFIQHFRMKRAAQLLEQGKINISEVSYKVGFRNPKYFSKCFQKKFGETPSRYSNKFSDFN